MPVTFPCLCLPPALTSQISPPSKKNPRPPHLHPTPSSSSPLHSLFPSPHMANHHHQPASPAGVHLHHGIHPGHPQVNGHLPMQQPSHAKITPAHLSAQSENIWLGIGSCFIPTINSAMVANLDFTQAVRVSFKETPMARYSPTSGLYTTITSQFKPSTQFRVYSGQRKTSQGPWNTYKLF